MYTFTAHLLTPIWPPSSTTTALQEQGQGDTDDLSYSIPSATDYTPIGDFQLPPRQVASINNNTNSLEESNGVTAADPADALLMELHNLNPLEGFDFTLDNGKLPSGSAAAAAFSERTLRVLENDQALGQMLHHIVDEYQMMT